VPITALGSAVIIQDPSIPCELSPHPGQLWKLTGLFSNHLVGLERYLDRVEACCWVRLDTEGQDNAMIQESGTDMDSANRRRPGTPFLPCVKACHVSNSVLCPSLTEHRGPYWAHRREERVNHGTGWQLHEGTKDASSMPNGICAILATGRLGVWHCGSWRRCVHS